MIEGSCASDNVWYGTIYLSAKKGTQTNHTNVHSEENIMVLMHK